MGAKLKFIQPFLVGVACGFTVKFMMFFFCDVKAVLDTDKTRRESHERFLSANSHGPRVPGSFGFRPF